MKTRTANSRASLLRDQMVAVLRKSHNDLPADADKIISVADVEKAVALAKDTQRLRRSRLFLPSARMPVIFGE